MDAKPTSRAPSLAVCLVVAASGLLWTAAITVAITLYLGLTALSGWLIGLSLCFTTGLALALIIYEVRQAVDLPEADVELPRVKGIGFSALFRKSLLAVKSHANPPGGLGLKYF